MKTLDFRARLRIRNDFDLPCTNRVRGERHGLRGRIGDGQFQPVRILLLHQGPSAVRASTLFNEHPGLCRRVQKTHLLPDPVQM